MNNLSAIRRRVTDAGWDIVRYREFLALIPRYGVDLVFDVGANEGQFVRELRFWGYRGQIVSYEPCSEPFRRLSALERTDQRLLCVNQALGHEVGSLEFRIYADTRFSSALELKDEASMSCEKRSVPLTTLDAEFEARSAWLAQFQRVFLKLDTQGFEQSVLRGADAALRTIQGVMMECSLTPIYEGQWRAEEAISYMRQRGFTPWAVRRGFAENHREYEFDIIFFRESALAHS